jgi:hypothetical protein
MEKDFLFNLKDDVGDEVELETQTILTIAFPITAFPILDKAFFFSSLGNQTKSVEAFRG